MASCRNSPKGLWFLHSALLCCTAVPLQHTGARCEGGDPALGDTGQECPAFGDTVEGVDPILADAMKGGGSVLGDTMEGVHTLEGG